MDYLETVEFLYRQLPYFTRDGKAAYKKDLNNTLALCAALGNPQLSFKTIHVAGTNGKGSVCNMLSAILQENGYTTGLYTSPHLKDFRERIRINGAMVDEAFVIEFVERIKPELERIKPSFFELTVAMCFTYFAREKVDYAVIETGLGGRLDSTNVITPEIAVITNIGLDHADLLGDTLKEIAGEKAGIIKAHIPVVIGETDEETANVFIQKASEKQAEIFFADQNIKYYNTEIDTDLMGSFQQKNAVTVLQTIDILNGKGLKTDPYKTARALMHVKELTQFKGRWEILNRAPKIIADTGHNAHGFKESLKNLSKESYKRLHIVLGMVKDKDRNSVLSLLPTEAIYYYCQPNLPRALASEELLEAGKAFGLQGRSYREVTTALEAAKRAANEDDLIFIGGSTFVVAEVI